MQGIITLLTITLVTSINLAGRPAGWGARTDNPLQSGSSAMPEREVLHAYRRLDGLGRPDG
jgi:hypothetical protein